MGFFSWLTADTEESVVNTYAAIDMGMPIRPVYLLQPNGKTPIEETGYEGYGDFGGEDAYLWLARHNLPEDLIARLDDDDLRGVGVTLDCGSYYVDNQTGKKWSFFHNGPTLIDPEVELFEGRYDQIIPELGETANDLIQSGRMERKTYTVDVPLKFSFDKDAVYEDLPASTTCPKQGYFFNSEDDEDDDDYDED